jgi:hypothetical protein
VAARRVCGCGAGLEEDRRGLVCPACGARAGLWLVALDSGRLVAAADPRQIYLEPGLIDGLGLEVPEECEESAAIAPRK